MARLTLKMIDERVQALGNKDSYDREFIFDLLSAYGRSASAISRLRNGTLNVAANPDTEVAQKNVVYFKQIPLTIHDDGIILHVLESLRKEPHVFRFAPRFVIVTDFEELAAYDTKTGDNLIIPIRDIAKEFTFFLPWAGMEKAQYVEEAHADVKAAEQMGKLFDQLVAVNPDLFASESGRHSLNVFFTRLLFCLFAEDTDIFEGGIFTYGITSHTQADGSDVREYIETVFDYLDTPLDVERKPPFQKYPYVNGRLFARDQKLQVPNFDRESRKQLMAMANLQWQDVNPDIFGSMFQAIVTPGKRSNLGQHYTSVPNILKTIDPLFMDDLRDEFDQAYENPKRLQALLIRISQIKIFDPACGSGNFLIIAYKELRRLEHAILERLQELKASEDLAMFAQSNINIDHFYGIEIDDFACEVAILSLWIAKHQMNQEFKQQFGISLPLIPLKEAGRIVAGNANRIDWQEVCPNNGVDEIYLIGNPPYVGASMQTKEQKAEFNLVFGERKFSKNLDYISLWFVKGADYIRSTHSRLAFVTTNSVAQGDHVALLFPHILSGGIEIGFAYTSFKWANNAKYNAGVTVAVIGLRNGSTDSKYLFSEDMKRIVSNINPYIAEGKNTVVSSRKKKSLALELPNMLFGSKPTDGGFLILTPREKDELITEFPFLKSLIKRFVGADDYINFKERYCLWIEDSDVEVIGNIPEIHKRLEAVRRMREDSKKVATQKIASVPHKFGEIRYKPTDAIIVPRVSSERREYVPMGYLGPDTVISDAAFAVYDAQPWLFALLTSKMHTAWLEAVGGKLETRYRYSNTLVYNTFPVPPLTDKQKAALTKTALRILDVREYYCEYTLAELYDPDKMPEKLRRAHSENDELVDSLYRPRKFESDAERLTLLFDLYEKAVSAEQLQLAEKKSRTSKKTTRGKKQS
ncbi:MAG: class I SAM-dependent DNA methyltransferase [Corynebacterium sp.]|uniref:DNA methyltransferase n=1 Tax=Corynebacterium sp. TaxID=1720 RepID=UPI0026DCD03C|nr:DNA methyltransferase [Corynebacterium sp.]MDO5099798.1 class I SAM-dependent DNA methyltransferase [Corynebacterium sp.]